MFSFKLYVISKNWKSGDRLLGWVSRFWTTEQPIWRSIQQPISRSRLRKPSPPRRSPQGSQPSWHHRGLAEPTAETDLRNGPYLEALPCPGTPEIPIRPSFSNGWVSGSLVNFFVRIFPKFKDWVKFIILFIDSQPFFTWLFLRGSRWFHWIDVFFWWWFLLPKFQKVCLRENGRAIDARDLLFLKFSHAPATEKKP